MQSTTTNMNFTITTISKTVLNQDVLSIIDGYKTSAEHFELHHKVTKKLREQFAFIEKVILETENIKYQYQEEIIINCSYGEYLLDWIEDEKRARYQEHFDECFELEIDYGF